MNFQEKTINSQTVYSGKIMKVFKDDIELSTGANSVREVVQLSGGVVVVALKDENTILLVKQYRYPIKSAVLELPAGKLEAGEDTLLAAKRELEEETGYIGGDWQSLGYINPSPGFCDEKLHLFFAKNLTFKAQNPDDGEIIESFEYDIKEVLQMINSGEINDAKTICGIFRAILLNEMRIN